MQSFFLGNANKHMAKIECNQESILIPTIEELSTINFQKIAKSSRQDRH